MNRLSNLNLSQLAFLVITIVCVSTAVFIASASYTASQLHKSQEIWTHFSNKSKSDALTAIISNIGYDGMIHHFKNVILRNDLNRARQFHTSAGSTMAAIDQFAATGPDAQELAAIDALRHTVKEYIEAFEHASSMITQGHSPQEIDQAVRIDDKQAFVALKFLEWNLRPKNEIATEPNKIELIREIQATLGYGGMIHNFKNYVLRHTDNYAVEALKNLSQTSKYIKVIGSLENTRAERDALAKIMVTMNEYRRNISVARELVNAGKTPQQIDRFVKVNDVPAIVAIEKIINLSGHQSIKEGIKLSGFMQSAFKQSTLIIVLALISGIAVSTMVYRILFKDIIAPIYSIELAMTRLANGSYSLVMPQQSDNEVGRMVRAIEVFRKNAMEKDQLSRDLLVQKREIQTALENERAMAAMQRQFLSTASHEFRTPLAIIDSIAQRLLGKANKSRLTPEYLLSKVEDIRSNVQRIIRLMESTLSIDRLDNGNIELNIESCDIESILHETCARRQCISKNHSIKCRTDNIPASIQADRQSVEQMVENLLSNAVKYSPKSSNIEIRSTTYDDYIVVSVRDEGIGIDPEDMKNIGNRFFRAKSSIGIEGTGIGLNLVKSLVEMHDGVLEIESARGEGSKFTIRLPLGGPSKYSDGSLVPEAAA